MQDLLEDTIESDFFLKQKGVKFVTSSKNRAKRYTQINGSIALCQKANQQFNWHGDFVLDYGPVNDKYFLSEAVKKYVLSVGTKGYKTRTEILRLE